MTDLYDLANRVGAIEARLNAIPPQSDPLNMLATLQDVSWSGPRADGDVPTFDDTIHAFTNKPSAGSGFPVGPEDDTIATHEVAVGSGSVTITSVSDVDGVTASYTETVDALGNAFSFLKLLKLSGSGAQTQLAQGVDSADRAEVQLTIGSGNGGSGIVDVRADTDSSIAFGFDRLGFHGATPVVQAGTPTTLGDVITILQDLGLCS